ncbi:MAG: hypothetical protein Q9174_003073 [Haloplaca sp. 1 TL-2023]
MAKSLPWIPNPPDHHLYLLTTILILNFTCPLDVDGRPLGEVGQKWDLVMKNISYFPGWFRGYWGRQSHNDHGIVLIIVWKFRLPPQDFPFSRKEPPFETPPLQAITPYLAQHSRLYNVPLFLAPINVLVEEGTFELELLFLPRDVSQDDTFHRLFGTLNDFVETNGNRFDLPPWDLRASHHGWLLDDDSLDFQPVHVILLYFESMESERRFKNPPADYALGYPKDYYKRNLLDTVAALSKYGVTRESLHFLLRFQVPPPYFPSKKAHRCCLIQ